LPPLSPINYHIRFRSSRAQVISTRRTTARAHTGGSAAWMLEECGCTWVIVGHSDFFLASSTTFSRDRRGGRRQSQRHSRVDLLPIKVCVGETLQQRSESGETPGVGEAGRSMRFSTSSATDSEGGRHRL
jgi:triosephosphate isomerase